MGKGRMFSLYDVEQFLREAGAQKVNEKAIMSLSQELEDTASQLVDEAQMYASYAGRKRLINKSDVALAATSRQKGRRILAVAVSKRATDRARAARILRMRRRRCATVDYDKEKNILC